MCFILVLIQEGRIPLAAKPHTSVRARLMQFSLGERHWGKPGCHLLNELSQILLPRCNGVDDSVILAKQSCLKMLQTCRAEF